MSCKVTVRVSLGDPESPTVIGDDCIGSGLMWTEMFLPEWEFRYTYAPPSAWVPGNLLLAAVDESSAVVMKVAAFGASLSDLQNWKAILEAAVGVRRGEISIIANDGQNDVPIGGPWASLPTKVRWGTVSPNALGLFYAEGEFSLPVNPPGAP